MERVFMMDCGDGYRRADNGSLAKGPTAKTASYTLTKLQTGTIFSNKGAGGAVTFTLPAPKKGLWFIFQKIADQNLLIKAPTGSKVAASNDGKVYQNVTGSQPLAFCQVVCDGTDWWPLAASGTWAVNNA